MDASEAGNWTQLLRRAAAGDHFAQVYTDDDFLSEAVTEYASSGLRRGEGVILTATPAHRAAFMRVLAGEGALAVLQGQLRLFDAEDTLTRFTTDGVLDWQRFQRLLGGVVAEMRLEYPAVRAYGEMVDVLWQRGERDSAVQLEEFWNNLAQLQSFSLLCAYRMDNLDGEAYRGPLECICKSHTHLISARDHKQFDEAVVEASEAVLDRPLAQMLLSLSEQHRPRTGMPQGQATLLWLQRNMPRIADKVLAQVRSRYTD
ncbi:MAG TPA: MEDS domain-containing protein [Burkholderiales bacterium]